MGRTAEQYLKFEIDAEKARLNVLMALAIEDARKSARMSKKTLAQKMEMTLEKLEEHLEGLEEISWEMFIKFGLMLGAHWKVEPIKLYRGVSKKQRERFNDV